jgi:outer membrane protein OmpA-like peptidoglycan-associated protein
MFKNTVYGLFLLLLFSEPCFSQLSKGDKHYEKAEFIKAIPYYKKESRSKSMDRKQEALIKLGNSYRSINDYVHAEESYQKALEINSNVAPEVFYNYAQVLKVNNKYQEAAEQYGNYIRLSPNDEMAKKAQKFCIEIKYYLSKPIEYSVKNIESINTPKAEFSPFVMSNKLMFIAERESFDFVNYTVNDYNGEPFLNMYISNLEGTTVKKSKSFSKKLNSDYHDGPACVSSDGKTLYFTRVGNTQKKGYTNNAKIYTATGSAKSWKDVKPLELGSEDYSYGHPSISADNKKLYFTSNMPGGIGGKDIWVCERNSETEPWGTPLNLGPDINTTGDEMFPTIRNENHIYFSSNGLPGFGGLDIYSAKRIENKWILERNEGLDINSSTDDFGITFLNDTMGYFSSNRPGGKGNDDIYFYQFTNKTLVVSGTVLLTENLKDYAPGKKVVLYDEKGMAVDSTTTNSKGYFEFKNLDAEKKYLAVIEETDPQLVGKARYYLSERDSVIHRVTGKYGNNKFAFKNLPIDPNGLPDLYTDDDLVFAGTLVSGETNPKALKNAKLRLVNEFGDVVEETTTNEFGAFAFRNIPANQNYVVSVVEGDLELPVGTKVTLTNKSGKEVKSFYKSPGAFTFKVLNNDKSMLNDMDAEDVNLVMGIYGYLYDQDKRPISNAKITVKNPDGSNVQKLITSDKGKFNFKNLDADKDYLFEADANDPSLTGVQRIYIADSKGRIYKVIEMVAGKFSFKILEVDKAAMGEFVIDDPQLAFAEYKKAAAKKVDKGKKGPVKKEVVKKEEPPVVEEPVAVAEPVKKEEPVKAEEPPVAKAEPVKVEEPPVVKEEPPVVKEEPPVVKEEPPVVKEEPVKVEEPKKEEPKKEEPVAVVDTAAKVAPSRPEDENENELTMVIVENIYYAYGDYKLGPDGEKILDKAVEALREYPKLIMEVSSHTDAQSSSGFNLALSNRRAQTVVDYLVSKGISRSRLKARGFGETKILNHCTDNVTCSEEEHKINRRTEFKITKPIKK